MYHSNTLVMCTLFFGYFSINVSGEIEYNTINNDGSFQYRHSNDDIGGYFHSVSGSSANIVRGRYGSRDPTTGVREETVYTAGPRGFRVNGPKVHRKMDLAQYPIHSISSVDDPLSDPYDDPSYSFEFSSLDQSRSEDSDSTGRVRGLYSFIDDVGEYHKVRYAAGRGTGFVVSDAVPDNPTNVMYSSPLYKTHSRARGKMTIQRGPNGSYSLIAAGPDHRRAESRTTDGVVRGTYSYLDDKGVQRTVEYIAGAGIGYRVVKNIIGPGTHINPSVSNLRFTDSKFKLTNDYDTIDRGNYLNTDDRNEINENGKVENSEIKSARMGTKAGTNRGGVKFQDRQDSSSKYYAQDEKRKVNVVSSSGKDNRDRNRFLDSQRNNLDRGIQLSSTAEDTRKMKGVGLHKIFSLDSDSGTSITDDGHNYKTPSANNYNLNEDEVASLPPLISANHDILQSDRERDWVLRQHDSTIIKNVGKWYIGLPPGKSVRAHVQNIDILPFGSRRVPSPAEALRQDEITQMVSSLEH